MCGEYIHPFMCESLELSLNHPSLHRAQLESSFAEKDLVVLVGTKSIMSQ